MLWERLDGWLTLGAMVLVGCTGAQSPNQPNLTIGDGPHRTTLHARLVWTERDQGEGVRGLHDFAAGQGMYFPLHPARVVTIYMNGVYLDLDVAFIRNGRIVDVRHAKACPLETMSKPCPVYPAHDVVDAVLETPAGTLRADAVGQSVRTHALSVK